MLWSEDVILPDHSHFNALEKEGGYMIRVLGCLVLVGIIAMSPGFDLNRGIVPKNEILSGGVPKDGIPALLKPKFMSPIKARFLNPGDEVIGVALGGVAKAYPIRILNLHEVVNDEIHGVPIVVTF
jgi:hypothetical protein